MAQWILNQSTGEKPPEWRALLLIDPQRRQHTFQVGYALESFLDRQEIEHILDDAGQWFFNDTWISGIEIFLDQLFETLKNACQHAHSTRKEALKTQD